MKATVKSVRLTQNGDINVLLNDAKIIGRRKSGDNYVIGEDDNFTITLAQWRHALHNVVKGADFADMLAQDAINEVLDCPNTDRRLAATTCVLNGATIDVEASEYAGGEEVAKGYVSQYDGVKYNINQLVLSTAGNTKLKLEWAQSMGLSAEYYKML